MPSSHDDAENRPGLDAGQLWPLVVDRTREALRTGDLQPIETVSERLEQDGVDFIVRMVSSLRRKPPKGRPGNPFLPPDPALLVARISKTHACVLNKYNVIEHHLLFITRHFEDQELPLTRSDLAVALWALGEVDGLAFYNSGRVAGASQSHRHLQLVPLALVPDAALPISKFVRSALAPVSPQWLNDPTGSAAAAHECYVQLLPQPLAPYNLLVTREWMLVVPRAKEHWRSISVNALGFAGSLFVSNKDKLNAVREFGPMNLLREVSKPVREPG